MTLKPLLAVVALAGACTWIAQAQLGGLGRIKDRIDASKNKAKPVTDRAEKAADAFGSWSGEEEQQIGIASAAKMIKVFGLVESPAVLAYVNLVGSAVAQYAPRTVPYRFAVLNTDIIGAFALPGGYIFITRQALTEMKDESELAGALAHEIIHVSERHLESEIRSRKTSRWAVEEAKAVHAPAGTDAFRARVDALVNDLFDMRLSRDKEDAADERGSMLAAKAGYAPGGLLAFLETLRSIDGDPVGQRAIGQLLRTHPGFDDRIARLRPWAERNSHSGQTLEARFRGIVK